MKKLSYLVPALLILSACGGGGGEEATTDEGHRAIAIETVMDEFVSCRQNNDAPAKCKWHQAKAICGHYEIGDFVKDDADGGYLPYDELYDFVKGSDKWTKLGEADDQGALDEAQALADAGTAVIAISNKDGQGNVAIIIPGEMVASGSWGVKCPNCAVFLPNRPSDSFVGKTLNYAWSDPDDVWLFARK